MAIFNSYFDITRLAGFTVDKPLYTCTKKTYIYTCICANTHIYIFTHTFTHTCTYTQTCIYIYIYFSPMNISVYIKKNVPFNSYLHSADLLV